MDGLDFVALNQEKGKVKGGGQQPGTRRGQKSLPGVRIPPKRRNQVAGKR